jgi:hypothetical protein
MAMMTRPKTVAACTAAGQTCPIMRRDVERAIAFNLAQSTVVHDGAKESAWLAGFVLRTLRHGMSVKLSN